jgi:hypothetical protein
MERDEASLVEQWTSSPASLADFVEGALARALDDAEYGWYLASRARATMSGMQVDVGCDRYVIYRRDQPWAEGLAETYWSKRSPWPEGRFYALDLAIDTAQLVFVHSNDTSGGPFNLRSVALQDASTVSLHALAGLELARGERREMFERLLGFTSLDEIIRLIVQTCSPNVFSVT